jgi:lysophospholipase L1-like esterase
MIFQHMDRIVFAGDSVTDMGSQCPVGEGLADRLGRGYVRVVDSLLAAAYPEVYVRVTNSGISGDTSRDLLARFERDVISLEPDWISICIGVNDVWRQFDSPALSDQHVLPQEYGENMTKMIAASRRVAKGVFVLSPYYIEPSTGRSAASSPRKTDAYSSISRRCLPTTARTVIPRSSHGTAFIRIRSARR